MVSGGGPGAVQGDSPPEVMWESSAPAGMYGWDPEGGFHNAVWSGTLVLEHPCVYLDIAQRDRTAPVTRDVPLRSYLRLPQPLTRYNVATGEVWVGEHGPMSTGDEVVVVGSEGWQTDWTLEGEDTVVFEFVWSEPLRPDSRTVPICAADVSFWAAAMSPAGEGPADRPPAAELSGLVLHPWDPLMPHHDADTDLGFLVIEEPCTYFERQAATVDETERSRFFLHLRRPLVRFDTETSSMSYGDYGPLHTGDRVIMAGGHPTKTAHLDTFLDAGCSADGEFGEREYWGVLMEPCDSPSKYAWCAY
jgi:hypothetical protein